MSVDLRQFAEDLGWKVWSYKEPGTPQFREARLVYVLKNPFGIPFANGTPAPMGQSEMPGVMKTVIPKRYNEGDAWADLPKTVRDLFASQNEK